MKRVTAWSFADNTEYDVIIERMFREPSGLASGSRAEPAINDLNHHAAAERTTFGLVKAKPIGSPERAPPFE
jgi:hypothetical protein